MPQLGKYHSDRDNILHFLCTSGWANTSTGDVEAPTGYFYQISNTPADVQLANTEITSVIEDQLAAYDIEDTEEFRSSLVGHYLIVENSQGFVGVTQYGDVDSLLRDYHTLAVAYDEWAGEE